MRCVEAAGASERLGDSLGRLVNQAVGTVPLTEMSIDQVGASRIAGGCHGMGACGGWVRSKVGRVVGLGRLLVGELRAP